jgi:hypothetical protein
VARHLQLTGNNLIFKDIELLKTRNCLEIGMHGELGPPALNIDYLIMLSLVLYFKLFTNFDSTKTIEKIIEKYVLLALKPKISQRSETFCRRIFTFLIQLMYK